MNETSDEKNTPTDKRSALNREIASAIDQMEKIGWGEKFRFRCHRRVSCWTDCCHNTNLFLTPYDILRLKKRLSIDSPKFHDTHTKNNIDPSTGLPVITLTMDETKGACPFVTEDGCEVYADRPTSCRVYPLGQAATFEGEKARGRALYFVLEDERCKGWDEPDENTLEEWVVSQEIADYSFYNELVMRFGLNPALDPDKLDNQKTAMYYMALYDLDRFRDFVFNSSFLDRFEVTEELLSKLESSDEELLRFAISWLEFALLGMPSIELKDISINPKDSGR